MNIQIFGTKKCKKTQKAIRFFKERGMTFHFVDLNEKKISKGELKNILRSISLEELIDKECKEYKKQNLAYLSCDLEEKVLQFPLLLKTPIVRAENNVTAGDCPEIWKKWKG